MTIKESLDDVQKSNGTSCDPFSSLGNEQTPKNTIFDPFSILDQGNDPKNDILDTVTPFEIENDNKVAAESLSIGASSDTPLLQGVPTSLLPLRFQRLLDVQNDHTRIESETVEFIPGYIPSREIMNAVLFCNLICIIAIIKNIVLLKRYGGLVVYTVYGLVAALVVNIILSIVVGFRTYEKRLPLRAKDSQGNPKPWPGDWKGGVYLVGSVALLQFDPGSNKAWLFPLQSIVEVTYYKPAGRDMLHVTSLEVRSSDETFKHEIYRLEDREKGVQIQQWYQRCTNSSAEDP